MAVFKVHVVQGYKAERHVTVEVEADDMESAIENVASGAFDLPDFDDPKWTTYWDLQIEEYEVRRR